MEQNSKENLRSIAQSKFLEGLLNFQLKPGQLLSQREISQIINCSIPSVREALKILESKGIVKLIPHRGVLIKEISKKEVKDAKRTLAKYKWPTIDVTRKSVEETAASIIKIHEIYKNNG